MSPDASLGHTGRRQIEHGQARLAAGAAGTPTLGVDSSVCAKASNADDDADEEADRGSLMGDAEYHTPTLEELSFLRIVTRGYPELEAQIESCEVRAYDLEGYCDVRVRSGPPFRRERVDGPSLGTHDSGPRFVETLLWMNEDGFLDTVEVMEYPDFIGNIYQRYIESARNAQLTYRISP